MSVVKSLLFLLVLVIAAFGYPLVAESVDTPCKAVFSRALALAHPELDRLTLSLGKEMVLGGVSGDLLTFRLMMSAPEWNPNVLCTNYTGNPYSIQRSERA
jgi:hypothetical protein